MGDHAVFLSAGGYHHHIALNTWDSAGGAWPPPGTTGLYHVALLYPDRAALGTARSGCSGRDRAGRRLRPRRLRSALPARPRWQWRRALPRPARGRWPRDALAPRHVQPPAGPAALARRSGLIRAGRSRTGARPCRRRCRGRSRAPPRAGLHKGPAVQRPPLMPAIEGEAGRDAVHPVVQPFRDSRPAASARSPGRTARGTAAGPASRAGLRAARARAASADASRHARRAGVASRSQAGARAISAMARAVSAAPSGAAASCARVRPSPSAAIRTRWPSSARRSLWS